MTVVTVVVIVTSFSKKNWTPQQPMRFSQGSFHDSCDVLRLSNSYSKSDSSNSDCSNSDSNDSDSSNSDSSNSESSNSESSNS